MSYNINHRRHIVNYIDQYKVATPTQIVKALPKAKRTPAVYSTISQALTRFIDEGLLRRVGPGCYALAHVAVTPVDAMCRVDEVYNRILQAIDLGGRSMSATPVKKIYETLAQAGFKKEHVHKKTRHLEKLGLITKTKYFGKGQFYWSIAASALNPTEWRTTADGTGFNSPVAHNPKPRASKMPPRNGIAGESVPAHNVLRLNASVRRSLLPITRPTPKPQPQPAAPEQFTVPSPGCESSIFD